MTNEEFGDLIAEGSEKLGTLLETAGDSLGQSYAPGKWNCRQIIAHLADTETVFLYRFFRCIGEGPEEMVGFDPDRWVAELKSDERPVEISFLTLAAIRSTLAWYVQNLPAETLERTATHPHFGPQTAGRIAARTVIHFEHHLGQIEAALEGKAWVKDPDLEKKLGLPY